MNWNQDFVTFAMDSNRVIEILELVAWSELNVDILADSRGYHALFVILNFEV